MNYLSFIHSENQPLPKNCKFEDLKLSSDFTKIYKDKVCIVSLCNMPQNSKDCKLYNCKLEYINKMLSIKININNLIFEKLVYNGEDIPSRINFFKLLNRNHKRNFIISECISEIFSTNITTDFTWTDIKSTKYCNYKLPIYQRKNLLWMEILENKSNIDIPYLKSSILKLGNVYVDLDKRFFKLSNELNDNYIDKFSFKGGALIDCENSGKHKSMIIYCLNNTPYIKVNFESFNISNFKYNNYFLKTNANLIICDFKNFSIWKKYINELSDCNLKILCINSRTVLDKLTYSDIIESNFVIISTKYLANNNLYNEICQHFYFDYENICENIQSLATEYFRKFDFISKKSPILSHFHWYRIIFDNCCDEINILKKSYLSSIIKTLSSTYRWCICNSHMNFNENSFKNILSLLTFNYKFPTNINLKKIVTEYLFRYTKKNDNEIIKKQITWLTFNKNEKFIINNKFKKKSNISRPGSYLSSINGERFFKKICNCYQINLNSDIIFEKNLNEISKLLLDNNTECVNKIKKFKDKIKCEKFIKRYNNKTYFKNIFEHENSCCVCLQKLDELQYIDIPCLTFCGHLFCFSCIIETLKFSNKCPKCRKYIDINSIFLTDKLKTIKSIELDKIYGTKISYLFNNFIFNNKNNKKIIVSQFEDILEKINEILNKTNVKADILINSKIRFEFNNNIVLLSSTLENLPIFHNFYSIIFLDPLYNDPLNLQEKNIISSIHNDSNKIITIDKLYMKNSPEEYFLENILEN